MLTLKIHLKHTSATWLPFWQSNHVLHYASSIPFICPSTTFPDKGHWAKWNPKQDLFTCFCLTFILQIGMGQQYTAQWYPTSRWCHWSYNTGINWDEISRGWDFSTASLNGFHYDSPTPQLCYVKAAILRLSVAPPHKPSGVESQVFNCSCSTCL